MNLNRQVTRDILVYFCMARLLDLKIQIITSRSLIQNYLVRLTKLNYNIVKKLSKQNLMKHEKLVTWCRESNPRHQKNWSQDFFLWYYIMYCVKFWSTFLVFDWKMIHVGKLTKKNKRVLSGAHRLSHLDPLYTLCLCLEGCTSLSMGVQEKLAW